MLLSGCGAGGSATTVNSISITPSAATVAPGSQADFTATVNLTDATTSTSTAVSWEVNGVAGGNSTTGTIVSSATDNQVGIYTAPLIVPSTNNGQVSITAVAQQTNTTSTSTSTSNTVTSNTATVTVAVALGFSMSPTISTVPAGGTVLFSAILNGATDVHATWSVASSAGGNPGTMGATSGLYTAPSFPPPSNSITITGTDGSNSASETIKLVYSDHSLTGPYSFAYTGNNASGFSALAGSFVADGNGNIESGVEDLDSFQTSVTSQISFTGNYVVGPDGRGTVNLSNGNTWRFVLATNQHGVILRSDVSNTGSGTIDQQDVNALTNSNGVITGAYAFAGLGADLNFNPLAMGGKFSADGSGNILAGNNILDLNDGGTVTQSDRSLNGTYAFDSNFPGTGRGVLTLTSTSTGQRKYAFYTIGASHLRLVETDRNAYFAGDAFLAPAGSSFSAASLAPPGYVFTAGGNSSAGAYAAAGVFTSDGAGNMTGGAFDANSAGTLQTNVSLTSCTYSVDASSGRVDLKLCGVGTSEFAVYLTSENTAVMVELDPTAIAAGLAYQQQAPSPAAPSGNFALALAGQGILHSAPGSYQQDVEAQIVLASGSVSSGNLDINNFNGVFSGDPINTGSTTTGTTTTPESSIAAPGANGRGTAVITGTNPAVSYKLVYYLISSSAALLLDQDSGFILNGVLTTQF